MSIKVVCRMCLLDSDNAMKIFPERNQQSKVAAMIAQHFWFEPRIDDPISNMLCVPCWHKIERFHQYYETVVEAQNKLSGQFPVKLEPSTSHHNPLDIEKPEIFLKTEYDTEIIQDTETVDTFDSFGEQPFDDGNDSCDNSQRKSEEHFLPSDIDNTTIKAEEKIVRNDEKVDTAESECMSDSDDIESSIKGIVYSDVDQSNNVKKEQTRKKSKALIKTKIKSTPDQQSQPKKKQGVEHLKTVEKDDEKIRNWIQLNCDFCGQGDLQSFAGVMKHYREKHKNAGYIRCCKKKFYKRQLLVEHADLHSNPDLFKCEVCKKRYVHSQGLKIHMLRHTEDKSNAYKCDQCPQVFVTRYLLSNHLLMHTPIEQQKNICEECGKGFISHSQKEVHRRSHHKKPDGHMCHICAKVIRDKKLFLKHQLKHAGIVDPKVSCKECGAWLFQENMRKHMQLHTTAEHVCNVCGKVCLTKAAIDRHVRYSHRIQRTFGCSVCDKSFKEAVALKEHMATHTGEVLYTCSHCPKTFNSSANMHSHRKKMHPNEWAETRRMRVVSKAALNPTNSNNMIVSETRLTVNSEASSVNV